MQIFFVYDTSYCKADEDDPKDAVVYFCPSELILLEKILLNLNIKPSVLVSIGFFHCDLVLKLVIGPFGIGSCNGNCLLQINEAERYALCCQLVGVAQFLKHTFTSPSVLHLEKGKFAFQRCQNYVLVLGGSSKITGNMLKKQLKYLLGLFCFYHRNISAVAELYKNDRQMFLQKMEEIWNNYISVSQCFGSMLHFTFSALPVAALPKNSSAIYSKSIHLLHMCQMHSGVIAGVVFCQKWMLSTQLTPELTSYTILMQACCDTTSVCDVPVAFNLPPGVRLVKVYLTEKEMQDLLKYNHTKFGSHYRLHKYEKPCLDLGNSESVSSGSEGDIDSGNSSELEHNSISSVSDPFSGVVKAASMNKEMFPKGFGNNEPDSSSNLEKSRDSGNLSYSEHNSFNSDYLSKNFPENEPIIIKKLQKYQLRHEMFNSLSSCNSFQNNESHTEKMAAFSIKLSKCFIANQVESMCKHHSNARAYNFARCTSKPVKDNFNVLQVTCPLCFVLSTPIKNDLGLPKRWNSETDISDFSGKQVRRKMSDSVLPQKVLKFCCKTKSKQFCLNLFAENEDVLRTRCCKFQILKCRFNGSRAIKGGTEVLHENNRTISDIIIHKNMQYDGDDAQKKTLKETFKPYSEFNTSSSSVNFRECSHNSSKASYHKYDKRLSSSKDCKQGALDCATLNSDAERKEIVLYIQKYGDSVLVLLLNNTFDENLLSCLWKWGFSTLGSLEFDTKQALELQLEENFSICTCTYAFDNLQKTLHGKPHPIHSLTTEHNSVDGTIQLISDHFFSSPLLSMFSVRTQSKNICGYNSSVYQLYYQETENATSKPGIPSKRDSFSRLPERASRRIEKSLGISIF